MRSTRDQPFCWQEKKILRLFKNNFEGMELAKYITLYTGITWLDSDFNAQSIKWYSKTLANRTGLSIKWIPGALKTLVDLKIIEVIKHRNSEGHFVGAELIFTPENVDENIKIKDEEIEVEKLENTVKSMGSSNRQKTDSGQSTSGQVPPIEDSLVLEDSKILEDNHVHVRNHDFFDKLFEEISGGELRYHTTNQEAVNKLLKTMTKNEVADYIITNYEGLKNNGQVNNINAVFTELLVNGKRQINQTAKKEVVQKTEIVEEPKMNPKFDAREESEVLDTGSIVANCEVEKKELSPEEEERALQMKEAGERNFFREMKKKNIVMYWNSLRSTLSENRV